jgi:hypothetical protein
VVVRASTPRSYAEKPRTRRAACTETAQDRDNRNVEGIFALRRRKEAFHAQGSIVATAVALLAAPAAYALLGQNGVEATRLYEQLPAAA